MAVAKKAVPFMIAFVVALVLITYVPWFSVYLPKLLK
jgi:C4-dicarboxylate transporter DctM subunit